MLEERLRRVFTAHPAGLRACILRPRTETAFKDLVEGLAERSFDLRDVGGIVLHPVFYPGGDGEFAEGFVPPGTDPVRRCERFNDVEACLALQGKVTQQLLLAVAATVAGIGPCLFFEIRENRVALGEHAFEAHPHDQELVVAKMREDSAHRPFAGGRGVEAGVADIGHEVGKGRGRGGKTVAQIAGFHESMIVAAGREVAEPGRLVSDVRCKRGGSLSCPTRRSWLSGEETSALSR